MYCNTLTASKIRVALDISFVTEWYTVQTDTISLTRVIMSVMQALERRSNLEITLTGLCGVDPLLSSYLTTTFAQSISQTTLSVRPTVQSRFGLRRAYDSLMPPYIAGIKRERRHKGKQNLAVRCLVKALKVCDMRSVWPTSEADLFFSTYEALPPRTATGNLPRLLWIYDIINAKRPEWVSPTQTELQKKALESIDVKRDWVVCNSEYVRREVCDYVGLPPERVRIVPLAASDIFKPERDTKSIEAAKNKYRISQANYLLTLATFQPRKNVGTTIAAFAELVSRYPRISVSLVLAGSLGRSQAEIEAILQKMDNPLRQRIHLVGYVADEDLSALYSGARAFVFPSLAEGFGLPPLEAMRCGTPVIVSDQTSLPEVVGEAGIKVPPTDIDALSQAMYALLTDDALHARLSREGEARAKEYTWARCAEGLEEIFRSMLDNRQ